MKVFVAGATGVLGRPTVRALVEAGHAVRGTARGPEKADLLRSLGAEGETKRFTEGGGRGISLRYAAFYAPYAQSTLDTIRLARRRIFPVPGDGSNFVSSIHVDDGATAAVAALQAPAGVYNVTDDEPLRMRDYGRAITDAFGRKPPRRVPKWLFGLVGGGPAKYILSSQRVANARFKEKTGWAPKYRSAREGFQQVAQELKAQEQ